MSSFSSYNIISNALQAFQTALDVTGNNITNVNTEGYTRQRVEYGQTDALSKYGVRPYQLGQGVSVQTVGRIRDGLLDVSMWSAQSDLSKFKTMADALQQVQGAFPEPGDNGIAAALDKFFNAWSGLASNPGDAGAKLAVQQAGVILAGRVRGTFSQLNQIKTGVQQQLEG